MEIPGTKSTSKLVKSQFGVQSKGAMSYVQTQSAIGTHYLVRTRHLKRPQEKKTPSQQDFKLHTQERAMKRALFNYTVSTKLYLIEQQKKQIQRLHKMIKEEEIRMLRKEMIPRAQLMPFFDRPFFPQRSNRPLTVPREPSFIKSTSSVSCS